MKKNREIREKVKAKGIRLWQLADKLGMYDTELSKKLRYELNEEEKEQILAAIDEIEVLR